MIAKHVQKVCPMYSTTHLTPDKQNSSIVHVLHFQPLFDLHCSVFTRPLICSSYIPFCHPSHPDLQVPPCRSLCLRVKLSCLHVFVAVKLPWPSILNCTLLHNLPQLCFGPSLKASPSPQSPPSSTKSHCYHHHHHRHHHHLQLLRCRLKV